MRRLHGGDLSTVLRLDFDAGPPVVAKTGPMVAREARMLEAIRAAGAPAPEVLGLDAEVLFLAWLAEGTPGGAKALGTALARLHRARGATYGWPEDHAFGPVPIPNGALPDWPAFWAERRLMADPAALPADIARRIETVAARLSDLLPQRPAPALLHGDLWPGNVLWSGGRPHLIDPACYHGDAEVDLAMLALFGGPSAEALPGYPAPDAGWRDRRAVYQLWPALVHLRLFGSGYRGMVEARLAALGA